MVWPMTVLLSTEVQKSLELIVGPDEVKVVTSSREQGFHGDVFIFESEE